MHVPVSPSAVRAAPVSRGTPDLRGAAGRLAAHIEHLCGRGIALRAAGECVATRRTGAPHRHDAGCAALGVSHRDLARELGTRGTAVGLIRDAVEEAVREISAWGSDWHPGAAREAVAVALHRRITPRPQAPPEETQRGRVHSDEWTRPRGGTTA